MGEIFLGDKLTWGDGVSTIFACFTSGFWLWAHRFSVKLCVLGTFCESAPKVLLAASLGHIHKMCTLIDIKKMLTLHL